MLRTNSKELKNKIDNYILENFDNECIFDFEGYEKYNKKLQLLKICDYVKNEFERVKGYDPRYTFKDYACGLPSGGLFDQIVYHEYYKAVEIVGELLEQTDEQKQKYDNQQAMELLINLIYKQVEKNASEYQHRKENKYYYSSIYTFINDFKKKNPNNHYFDDDTLKFFGNTLSSMKILKDIETVSDCTGKKHKCYVLSKKQYINGFISKEKGVFYDYFDINTLEIVLV